MRECLPYLFLFLVSQFHGSAMICAQDVSQRKQAAPNDETADGMLLPPQVVSVAPVNISEQHEHELENSVLKVRVAISTTGNAVLSECSYSENVCAVLATALEHSQFEPATRNGEAIPSIVAIEMSVNRDESAKEPAGASEPNNAEAVVKPPKPKETPTFGAKATVATNDGSPTHLSIDEVRMIPGTFGEPFRAIEALPGVTPVLSGTPYVYVRGAPPSGTAYYYDDIPVPALFHLALGPSVIHSSMIGDVDLYAGVAPARYGRLVGGAVVGQGADPSVDKVSGEAELRLIDVSAMVRIPIGKRGGTLTIAGRYGYPALLLSAFAPQVSLQYWDYQSRLNLPINSKDTFQLVWFGSFDKFKTFRDDGSERQSVRVQFHRAEARFTHKYEYGVFGAALMFGQDESALDDNGETNLARFAPRLFATYKRGAFRMRVGADLIGIFGRPQVGIDDFQYQLGPAARSTSGAYVEVALQAHKRLMLEMGLRLDLWIANSLDVGVDPRLRATYQISDKVNVHAAVGLVHQPAVFIIPLPGLSDVSLDNGLQSSVQGELGVSLSLPAGFSLEVQGFVHRFSNLIFPDPFLIMSGCGSDCVESRVSAVSYGMELFLKRDFSKMFSGWLSYTLSNAEFVGNILKDVTTFAWALRRNFLASDLGNIDITPSFDIRHVFNLVFGFKHPSGWSVGLRIHARSGRALGRFFVRNEPIDFVRYEQRFPWFYRIDAQVAYRWNNRWGSMEVKLEWLNTTLSKESFDLQCTGLQLQAGQACNVEFAPAIWFPSLGLRAEF